MRILKLTDAAMTRFFARRRVHDAEAEGVALRIVADVRRKGDAALFRWVRRLDGLRLSSQTIWIDRGEIAGPLVISDVDHTVSGKQHTIPTVAGRHDTIKHVYTPVNTFQDVDRVSNTHQVPWFFLWKMFAT